MELDLFIPSLKVAIEYHGELVLSSSKTTTGEQHYHDMPSAFGPSGTLAMYSNRDLIKQEECLRQGTFVSLSVPMFRDNPYSDSILVGRNSTNFVGYPTFGSA